MNKKPTLSQLIKWSHAKSSMARSRLERKLKNIWMDSRNIQKNDVFLALETDKDDGHKYVDSAFDSGAISAIVSSKKIDTVSRRNQSKLIIVDDPLEAVSQMAYEYRKFLDIPMIAITGSNGKTTTRQFMSKILQEKYEVGETNGNWNNHIGVPLSLLRFSGSEEFGVLELGANHENEIAQISKIVQPDMSIITNIGYAHIGNFKTLSVTAKTKMEIIDGMESGNGILLINGDDSRLVKVASDANCNIVLFGTSEKCQIRATDLKVDSLGRTQFFVKDKKYKLSMPGRHFVYSALPAIFISIQLGIPDTVIADALSKISVDPLRGKIRKKKGVKFIVDCYNANPSSMQSSIQLLKDVSNNKPIKAIVGDMLELGKYSKAQHIRLGKQLAEAGVSVIIAVGKFADDVAVGAMKSGFSKKDIFCVESYREVFELTDKYLNKDDTVLLKGSRSVKLEKIFEKF